MILKISLPYRPIWRNNINEKLSGLLKKDVFIWTSFFMSKKRIVESIINIKFAFAVKHGLMVYKNRFMKKISCALLLMLALTGCKSTYQKAMKSEDVAYKIAAAHDLYEKGKYRKATRLYEQAKPKIGIAPEAQMLYINYAKSQMALKNYELATPIIKEFNLKYPSSVFREEMMYLEAYTLYLRSEDYKLDQLVTHDGIAKFQEFLAAYPQSEKADLAKKYSKELVEKIERKAFENAKLYNKIGEYTRDYNAAMISLDNFMLDYPGSVFKEDALFYKFDSAYKLAINSVYSKMEERLKNAQIAYKSLISFNENTKYKADADQMLARVEKELQQFTN